MPATKKNHGHENDKNLKVENHLMKGAVQKAPKVAKL
jgi:hypothetical protein